MEQQNGRGRVMFQCIICDKICDSSQSIAGHTKGHFKDGWVKGTRQRKLFVPCENNQVQQEQQQQQVEPEIDDTTNVHQADAQNPQNPPSYPARRRPLARENHLGPRRSPVHARSILNPSLVKQLMWMAHRPRGRMPYMQEMVKMTHRYPPGRMRYIDNQPQQQAMVQMPHFAAPQPVAPRLIQARGLQVARPANQLVPDGFLRNLHAKFAAWRAGQSTHSSTGSSSTVTVTADPMHGNKNEDQEVEEIDLELRL
ncbi:hypothetical protein K7X08_020004 [Anisodus acutangulus]|uniref:C2H2-type domain-containing protein n=1 Tax=Anisodus acutangulus TaxID=402998 RepID=A0A9Q1RR64_9SOLA|nr:hypothetical protein K7X08_020004 [Anisodus acutangulus]